MVGYRFFDRKFNIFFVVKYICCIFATYNIKNRKI